MGESDLSLNSAVLISSALLFPIVALIAGCAICRRLCRGNGNDDEERQPLLTEGRQESQSRIERVENEQTSHQRREAERHSPATTREQPEQTEERREDTRQQEAQPVVVAVAPLIPDLLQIEEQEPETSHQTEPDILEPRPFTDNRQYPQYEHKEITVVKERVQQELPPSELLEGQLLPNLDEVPEQLITTDREPEQLKEREEINVKFEAPTLHTGAEGQLIPNLEDVQEQIIAPKKETEHLEERKEVNVAAQAPSVHTEAVEEAIQSSTQDQEQLLKTPTLEDNDTTQIVTESEPAIVQTVKDKEHESVVEQKLQNSSLDQELRNETPQDSEEPLLPEPQKDYFSAELQDRQTDTQATIPQTEQHDSEAVLSRTPPIEEDSSPVTTATEEQKPSETMEKTHGLSDPVQEQPETTHSDDIRETTAALNTEEESKKEEEKIEEQTLQPQDEPSSSTKPQRVEGTPDEAANEAEEAVKVQLQQAREPASKVEINFDVSPSFVKIMRTKAAKKDSKAIFGLTVLDQELFIISEHSPDVEVYDMQSLDFKHQFHLEGLFDPVDIKSCSKNHCLYIFDWEGESNEIRRVASDGKLIINWKTGDDGGYLSVTQESNVILSVWDKNLLREFTADGQLIRDIQLPVTISELRLAIKLSNGHFVVSQGEEEESEHRVCLVDDKGVVIKSIGGKQGSSKGEFDSPNYMVVDGTGFILVADQNNKRVVLLSPDLEFKQELIQEKDGLRYPVRMDLDQRSGRLFFADNDYLEDHTGWRDGRLIAFDFKIRH